MTPYTLLALGNVGEMQANVAKKSLGKCGKKKELEKTGQEAPAVGWYNEGIRVRKEVTMPQ